MENKIKNFMSAVIYVHNEQNAIAEFLKSIVSILEDKFEHSEIICVNDCSNDHSVEIIKEISNRTQSTTVSIVNMSYFHGLEVAMSAGRDLAIGDFVLEFDSVNLDFDVNVVMEVYNKSLEGFDIVSASPNQRQKMESWLFYKVLNKFSHLSYKMRTERFRILSRRVINRIDSMSASVPYRKVIYANCGLKMFNLEYPVVHKEIKSIDKQERRYRKRLSVDAIILFTELGYRFSMIMTGIMMVLAIFMVGYSVLIYSLSKPVEGWTTTIIFMSVAFFGLFAILTIIIKYLQILVDLIFKKKKYSFESIEKLTK